MKKVILLCFIGLFVSGGCTSKKETPSSLGKVTKEKELYLNHCANCHGGDLEGSFGPPLKGIEAKYSQKQILEIIQKGKDNMPAQDYIAQEEQEMLAKWLSKN